MRLAVMQPYLFPYIGYYQLAWLSDKTISHDVNHPKSFTLILFPMIINGI